MATTPHVVEVTDQSFESEVIDASHETTLVVDFWAPWCGPCKQLGPVLESLAAEGGGDWILAKLNVDDNQQAAQSFGVRGIPAVKAFVDGEIVDQFTGAKPRSQVEGWLESFLPSESDEQMDEADRALEQGEVDRAEELYRSVLDEQRNDPKALVGLARVALARGEADQAAEWLDQVPEGLEDTTEGGFEQVWLEVEAARAGEGDELEARIDEDPDDLEARYELGMRRAAGGEYEAALEHLLEIVRRDREFRDALGRQAMIRLFEVMPDSESVREWRQKMGRAMYV